MTEAHTPATPRVTLLLLSYNQEAFVEQAIAAAFEQDYPNLEIILSDDASTDATYAKMLLAHGAYRGPHTVVTRCNPTNQGVLSHVYSAVAESTGDLVILAACDDVSRPARVRRTVEEWRARGCDALFSGYEIIDDSGKTIAPYRQFLARDSDLVAYFPERCVRSIHGASSAYARTLFDKVPLPREPILFEDTFFSLMIGLLRGKVHFIDEPLVRYREHSASISNSNPNETERLAISNREKRSERMAASIATLLGYFETVARAQRDGDVDLARVQSDVRFYLLCSHWTSVSLAHRLIALVSLRRMRHVRWLLPRLLGLNSYVLTKRLKSKLQKLITLH